jgi:O-antigen ligase
MIFLIVKFRIRLSILILLAALVSFGIYSYRVEILMKLEQNKQTSSGDFAEHVQSISNITSDASNMERINRWHSALRMFKERPFFGWGPGTYQFQYAPFQYSGERTFISTNFGDRGNSHSEYIGPLAESGIPGTITFLLIVITSLITGIKTYYRTTDAWIKMLSLVIILGLCTYFLHGFLNNFLDSDKASAPFWGFIAILVVLDIKTKSSVAKPGG